jgi:hypothetical protein
MAYNGWDNYETWKFNIEVLDTLTPADILENLGYQPSDEMPTDYEIAERLKDYAIEYLFEVTSDPYARSWARSALESVNYLELSEHILYDAKADKFFEEEEEEEV